MEKLVEKKIKLNDGSSINAIGIATHNFKSQELLGDIILSAFALGYKRLEISPEYNNSKVLRETIFRSVLLRNEIYLSCLYDPLNISDPETHRNNIKDYTYSMGTEYLDMILVKCNNECWKSSLEAIVPCMQKKRIKTLGVRFATIEDIKFIKDKYGFYPAILQMDIHPGNYKSEIVDFCIENNIVISSTNLMLGGKIINIKKINEIADKYDFSPFQVAIKWAEQRQIMTNIRTNIITQIKESISVNGIFFTDEELLEIDNLKYEGD